MKTRLAIGLLGTGMLVFGAISLLDTGWKSLSDTIIWLGGGVVLHDAVLAPLTIIITVVLRRLVPAPARSRVTVAMIVLVTVTATAVPVLGGFGRRPDNPSVLPRDYAAGWLEFAALVLLVVVAEGVWHGIRSRRRRRPHGA